MNNLTVLKFEQQIGNQIYRYPVTIELEGSTRYLSFAFNRWLIDEIKAMKGARWHPERKQWSVPFHERNEFQLNFLMGLDPYGPYDVKLDLSKIPKTRYHKKLGREVTLFRHQPEMTGEMFLRHYKIIAGEMGTSKTLSAIICMEMARDWYFEKYGSEPEMYYVAPKSGVLATTRELDVWGSKVKPQLMTYEGLVKVMKNWEKGKKAPFLVVLDEASKVKNENSLRAQAAQGIGDGVRADWGKEGYLIEMSGSPAPKSPVDWYSLAEIACPGFIKEGDVNKFKRRLGIIVQKESIDGGVYPQLVTWRDDEKKCNTCGLLEDDPVHHPELAMVANTHSWIPSKNEVKILYERLRGLVSVYFKKDCLDLPEKHYKIIECKPKPSTLRAAKLIGQVAKTTVSGLILLRELSDGFQYKEIPKGEATCHLCKGSKELEQPREIPNSCPNCLESEVIRDSEHSIGNVCGNHVPKVEMILGPCPNCGGEGVVKTFTRETVEVPCPKDDALSDVLDEHEDVGRIVIFAGFTGSIDRCIKLCHRHGWSTIRMDQGKVVIEDEKGNLISNTDFQSMFQDDKLEYPKLAFVAHPKSGGMGLTLTASPTILYFSNTFDAEDRIQSEDRIHRAGMDVNKGATIIDLVHLPSDQKILDNLKKKRDLQAMTLGDFMDAINSEIARPG